jgi:hypothetical protein
LLIQGTAVRTHIHSAGQMRPAASGAQTLQPAKPGNGDDAANCPLCQEAATAGAYVLPPAVVLPSPPPTPLWAAAVAIRTLGLSTSAHSWRSRAPPQ